MAAELDVAQLSDIDGIRSYYLVRYDGEVVSSQGDRIDNLFPYIAFSGINSDAIRSSLGFSQFKYMILSRRCRESVIIFSLTNSFLAIVKKAEAATPDLIKNVHACIQTVQGPETSI